MAGKKEIKEPSYQEKLYKLHETESTKQDIEDAFELLDEELEDFRKVQQTKRENLVNDLYTKHILKQDAQKKKRAADMIKEAEQAAILKENQTATEEEKKEAEKARKLLALLKEAQRASSKSDSDSDKDVKTKKSNNISSKALAK